MIIIPFFQFSPCFSEFCIHSVMNKDQIVVMSGILIRSLFYFPYEFIRFHFWKLISQIRAYKIGKIKKLHAVIRSFPTVIDGFYTDRIKLNVIFSRIHHLALYRCTIVVLICQTKDTLSRGSMGRIHILLISQTNILIRFCNIIAFQNNSSCCKIQFNVIHIFNDRIMKDHPFYNIFRHVYIQIASIILPNQSAVPVIHLTVAVVTDHVDKNIVFASSPRNLS